MRILATMLAILVACGFATPQAYPEAGGYIRDCGDPGAAPEVCRLRVMPTPAEAEKLLGERAFVADRRDDRLTIVARWVAAKPVLAGAIAAPLAQLDGTDLWSVTVRSGRLDEAMLDLFLVSDRRSEQFEWLGPKARARPEAIPLGKDLSGRAFDVTLDSATLGRPRSLTVYLPPGRDPAKRYPVVYMADGQALRFYSRIVDASIVAHRAPPVIIVGLHNGGNEQRSKDYLLGWEETNAGFEAHEAFLIKEVMPRAEREWGAASDPQRRLVIGKSSGAAWAVDTALRNPGLFRQAAGFAVCWTRGRTGLEDAERPRLMLVAGVFDPCVVPTRTVAAKARASGGELVFLEPVTGHGDLFYQALLEEALIWAFGKPA